MTGEWHCPICGDTAEFCPAANERADFEREYGEWPYDERNREQDKEDWSDYMAEKADRQNDERRMG
jgi:hypothetical protein